MTLPFELPKNHKQDKKKYWKWVGIDMHNFDEFYERYINSSKCELCEKVYKNTYDRCLDHCHKTGKFRNVVCRSCNLNITKQKFNTNTGEQYISKVKNKRSKTGYYFQVKIQRNKQSLLDKARNTLEKAIELRDNFIKENPSLFV